MFNCYINFWTKCIHHKHKDIYTEQGLTGEMKSLVLPQWRAHIWDKHLQFLGLRILTHCTTVNPCQAPAKWPPTQGSKKQRWVIIQDGRRPYYIHKKHKLTLQKITKLSKLTEYKTCLILSLQPKIQHGFIKTHLYRNINLI